MGGFSSLKEILVLVKTWLSLCLGNELIVFLQKDLGVFQEGGFVANLGKLTQVVVVNLIIEELRLRHFNQPKTAG